ncbi:isoprenoid synthase domain-containing protein [Mycena leptocephala]|nr:isoprenoid synthase domain-containing protein [Mycena leptocephala]
MSTLPTPFAPARDHARAKELIADTNSFVLESWPFASQEQRDLFVRCDFAALMTKNDTIERQGVPWPILTLGNGQVPKAGSPVQELIHRTFREIQATAGVEQYGQLSRLACEFYASQSEAPVCRNISEYLDFRCANVGGSFMMALCRYALNIDLTNDELQNPLLAACERFVIDACAMENDVASYEKERQQNTLGNNLVAMFLEHGTDGRVFDTASAAQHHIRQLIADSEAQAQAAITVALADKVFGSADLVHRWLRALPYIIGGNAWWSQLTARYNIPGNPVPRRVIHLEGKGDIMVPEP